MHDNFKLVNECHNYNNKQRRNNYFTQRARTKFGQNALLISGVKIWNDIPQELKVQCLVYTCRFDNQVLNEKLLLLSNLCIILFVKGVR